ncbi:SUKH-4 family immunity protein, partial [Streptomyces sp. NPDC055721]
MVTFAQAQERAEEWINGDLPAYQHREVRVREFELGFVVWAEDRQGGPVSDGGRQRLVIARDSGEATLWPGLPVGEVIRRYEEEYGSQEEAAAPAAPQPARIDLNQTSFLLSPPEWLQDAADKIGLPQRPNASQEGGSSSAPVDDASDAVASDAGASASDAASVAASAGAGAGVGVDEPTAPVEAAPAAPVAPVAPPVPPVPAPVPTPAPTPAPAPAASPWADANASSGGADGAVPLPATVFAPPLSGTDDEDTPPPLV